MNRLTTRDSREIPELKGISKLQRLCSKDRVIILDGIDRLAAYEDTGLEPEEVNRAALEAEAYRNICVGIGVGRMAELAQAEKDGRLVMLPCRVGDVVYEANKRGFISTYKVISIHLSACSTLIGWELMDGVYSNLNGFEAPALGKTVFLTREEAEEALEKREEKNHEQNKN